MLAFENFSALEISILKEFSKDSSFRINIFKSGTVICDREESDASEWCLSDEARYMDNWDAFDSLEANEYIYHFDDDYYRLTKKGLIARNMIMKQENLLLG